MILLFPWKGQTTAREQQPRHQPTQPLQPLQLLLQDGEREGTTQKDYGEIECRAVSPHQSGESKTIKNRRWKQQRRANEEGQAKGQLVLVWNTPKRSDKVGRDTGQQHEGHQNKGCAKRCYNWNSPARRQSEELYRMLTYKKGNMQQLTGFLRDTEQLGVAESRMEDP